MEHPEKKMEHPEFVRCIGDIQKAMRRTKRQGTSRRVDWHPFRGTCRTFCASVLASCQELVRTKCTKRTGTRTSERLCFVSSRRSVIFLFGSTSQQAIRVGPLFHTGRPSTGTGRLLYSVHVLALASSVSRRMNVKEMTILFYSKSESVILLPLFLSCSP